MKPRTSRAYNTEQPRKHNIQFSCILTHEKRRYPAPMAITNAFCAMESFLSIVL